MRVRLTVAGFGLVAVAAAACQGTRQVADVPPPGTEDSSVAEVVPTDRPEAGDFEGTIQAQDQSSDGTTVEVDAVSLNQGNGWVAIFTEQEGGPSAVIGTAAIQAAEEGEVIVELDEPLEPGEYALWAQLLIDAVPVGEFNWPGEDQPVTRRLGASDAGDVLQERFTLTVE